MSHSNARTSLIFSKTRLAALPRTHYVSPYSDHFIMGVLMSLLKQAKTLSKRQIALTTALLQQTRYPARNLAIFLLSVKAGLRAKEIASLTWDMLTDAEGNLGSALHLRDEASKGSSGRVIPLNKDLRSALQKLHDRARKLTLRHHH